MLQQAGFNCTISYQNRNVTCAKRKGVCQRGRGGGRLSLWPSVTVPLTHSLLMKLVTNKRKVELQLVMSCLISTTGWSFVFKFLPFWHHSKPPLFSLFFPSIKIGDGWEFLRSHFSRPYEAKCKNHLKFSWSHGRANVNYIISLFFRFSAMFSLKT